MDEFKDIQSHALELEQASSARDALFKRMEQLYWMEWPDEQKIKNKIDNVKLTKSPRGRNAIKGAERLLTATDPDITIPFNLNNNKAKQISSKLEKFAQTMWFASGRISQRPIHYDIAKSALIYSMINIAITSTKDLLDNAPDIPAVKRRYEKMADRTPFIFEVWNPQSCYPEYDSYGLKSFYRKVKMTVGDMMSSPFAKPFMEQMKSQKPDFSSFKSITLKDYYDLEKRAVWVDGFEKPLYMEAHGLPVIPIISQLVEGSRLFEDADGAIEEMFEPFLYTLDQSQLIERQNLLLTVLYTITFAIGANPMFVDYLIDPESAPPVDETYPGKRLRLRVGERTEPLVKQVIDPSMIESWNTAIQLEEESTIPRQTLGEPLAGNQPYSSVALLHQAGRLPLLMAQRMGGWAIGSAIERAFEIMKHNKYSGTAKYQENEISLKHTDIPDHFEVMASLEISLPQDDLTNANVARIASEGDDPLVSKRYAREKLLKVNQSEEMQEEIWSEMVGNLKARKYFLQKMAEIGQLEQMALQPAGPQQGIPMGGPGPLGPGIPPGMPPGPMPTDMPFPTDQGLGPEPQIGNPPMVEPNPLGNMPQEAIPFPGMLPNQEPLP